MAAYNLILDTGAAIACFDPDDRFHFSCNEFLKNFQGKLLTTEAILTETLYMLRESFAYQKACIEFFLDMVDLVPLSSEKLVRIMDLMEKYQDIPMDFADASLVVLAEELECRDIFTVDRRGFETYRWGRSRTFKIFPDFRA